jgi:hypothetical protein
VLEMKQALGLQLRFHCLIKEATTDLVHNSAGGSKKHIWNFSEEISLKGPPGKPRQ